MSNVIDASLYPILYSAMKKIARDKIGCIQAVNHNFANAADGGVVDLTAAGKDKTFVTVPVAGIPTEEDWAPAQTPTVGGDTTDTKIQVQITASRMRKWHMTVDEMRALRAGGNDNAKDLFRQKMSGAINGLLNTIEAAIAIDIAKYASRARGTAGVAPFASDLSALASSKRELDDNGVPDDGMRSFVMASAGYENFMNLTIVQQANVAASAAFLRDGTLLDHLGFKMRYSPQLAAHTKGTATGFDAFGGEAIGEEEIAVDGSDSGTILAADVVTWVGDDNKYMVKSATASGAADGNITIGAPGLKATLADTVEGVIGANYTPNYAIHKNSYVLAMRAPSIESNNIVKAMPLVDPVSGLTLTLVEAPGDGLTTWRVHLAYGFKGINEFMNIVYLG